MHRITTTEGIVLAKRTQGEANTRVVLLTKELGVVRVSARSARLERSKLRYGLETLTHGTFSLLRGKHDWKLTGTGHLSHEFVPKTLAARRVVGRVVRLLLRLVPGEGGEPGLYETVAVGLAYAAQVSDDELPSFESVLVFRVLSHLGYVESSSRLDEFLHDDTYTPELLAEAGQARALLIRAINESLGATGLL